MKRFIGITFGIFLSLLGGLWTLQGAGIVNISPVLCVTECEPVIGGSPVWLAVGLVVLLIGVATTIFLFKAVNNKKHN